jgi:hypothetical protein
MVAMKAWRTLRPSTQVVTVYAAIVAVGAALAFGVAPETIASAYRGRSLPILNWALQSHRSLPLGHYLEVWRGLAIASLIAVVLHLGTVLVIMRLGRRDPSSERPVNRLATDVVLIAFSALFLLTTVITGADGDYYAYGEEWRSILDGHNPWQMITRPFNAYGPLFNLMAITTPLSPLVNKLLFSFSYILFVIWLTKWPKQNSNSNIPRSLIIGSLILSPYSWTQLSWLGYFDILVGVACVASLYSLSQRKEGLAGAFLALGILLKFMPIVIFPFLAFSGRRFNWRLVGVCLALVALGFLAGFLVWGASEFTPLRFVATRSPRLSIYAVLNSDYSAQQFNIRLNWLERFLSISSIFAIFTLYMMSLIDLTLSCTLAILVTLLFSKLGYANYQIVVLCMVSYWMVVVSKNSRRLVLFAGFLICYFVYMAIKDFYAGGGMPGLPPLLPPEGMILTGFVLGCLLLAWLLWLSMIPGRGEATPLGAFVVGLRGRKA